MHVPRWLGADIRDVHVLPDLRMFGGTPGPTWTLGLVLLLRGVTLFGVAAFPLEGTVTPIDRPIIGAIAFALGVALLVRGKGVPGWFLHLNVTAWMLCLGWFMITAPAPMSIPLNLLGGVAIALYAGAWFQPLQLRVHLAFLVAVTGFGLAQSGNLRGLASLWFSAMAISLGSALLLNIIMRRILQLARTDALTGVLNRDGLAINVDAPDSLGRFQQPVCVVVIDLDGFKQINDQQGHRAGDVLLREVGEVLRANTRSDDLVARTGGDEFLILLAASDESVATAAIERLLERLPTPASFGIGLWRSGEPFDRAFAVADEAMYRQKTKRAATR